MARKQKSGSDTPKKGSKGGGQMALQSNEGQRSAASRNDRDTQVGTNNQSRSRKGGPGAASGGKSR